MKIKIVFWGIGNTAIKNIDQIKGFSDQIEIIAFTDSCQDGIEKVSTWKGYKLVAPYEISQLEMDYVCILSVWEWEIRRQIYKENLFDLSKIVDFHEICMMDAFGIDVNNCYEKMIHIMHPNQVFFTQKWRIYESLKRKYSYVLCDSRYWKVNVKKKEIDESKRPIWVLWLQGFENAPEIVKACVHSLENVVRETEKIFLLDGNNLFDYIDLPTYIIKKWKEGIISNTHLSDLIRVQLLNMYGGIWIDATVYFTSNELPDYMTSNKLFMFSRWLDWRECPEPRLVASWLIAAQPANKLLMILEALQEEYWKKENSMEDYYLTHLFITLIAECFPDEWERMEIVMRDPAQLLNEELSSEFDNVRYEHLKRMSDVHKLSYKKAILEKDNCLWSKIGKVIE